MNVKDRPPVDGQKRAVEARRSNTKFERGISKEQQGVQELKRTYSIESNKVIGAGAFGRVFAAYHTADT